MSIDVHGGDLLIGSPNGGPLPKADTLCSALTLGGLPSAAAANINREVASKFVYNCVVNPLSAITAACLGKAAAQREWRPVVEGIVNEVFAVLEAERHTTIWPNATTFVRAFYEELLPRTSSHFSSMYRDLNNGCKTEIGFLNGAVVEIGKKHHIATPWNKLVANAIRRVELCQAQSSSVTDFTRAA